MHYTFAGLMDAGLLKVLASVALWLGVALPICADWPTYRGDYARSGVASEDLSFPLQPAWTVRAAQPPQPAWPAPARSSYWQRLARIEPRVTDDTVFHPVADATSVYWASSADDQVHCYDLATGRLKWTFFAEGPLRYAPTLADGRVYIGGDDGFVYCLDGTDGSLAWKHRVGPADRLVPGNNRMISLWPVRSGVIVEGGVAYALAGLFPSQGVFACALDAADGSVVWKRRLDDHSPQGYLLAGEANLYVPTGRANPIAIDRRMGAVVRAYPGVGGTYALLMDDVLVAGRGNDGSLAASDVGSRETLVHFVGRQMAVTADRSYLQSNTHLVAIDRPRHLELVRRNNALRGEQEDIQRQLKRIAADGEEARKWQDRLHEVGQAMEQVQQQISECELWRVANEHHHALALAGSGVIVAGDGVVKAFAATDGRELWTAEIDGEGHGLAVAGNALLVSTDRGVLHCFAAEGAATAANSAPRDDPAPLPLDANRSAEMAAAARQLADAFPISKGYGLVLGAASGQLAYELAQRTALTVVVVDDDADRVRRLRSDLAHHGLYGSRVSVLHRPAGRLPFTDYFANVVVSERAFAGGALPWPAEEVARVLRPGGGIAWLDPAQPPFVRPSLPGAGTWDHPYGSTANTSSSDDRHVHHRLELQWFGGPGPYRMVDRHLRGPAPLVVGGQLFIMGRNVLIAVDAYNGTVQWDLELPDSQRYSMPYDCGYVTATPDRVYVAVNDHAWVVDAATGERTQTVAVPREGRHWGYMAFLEGTLVGSAQKPTASRTESSREIIDRDYRSRQALVTGDAVFRIDPASGRTLWTYGQGAIVNSTITLADGRKFFLESRNAEAGRHDTGRIPLSVLAQEALYLVALEAAGGEVVWERPLDLTMFQNVVYLAHADGKLVLAGTRDLDAKTATYHLRVLNANDGQPIWQVEHPGRRGDLTHGEQVQHFVILGQTIVSEPFLYDLATGEPVCPDGGDAPWSFTRPGHSCGTMTGAGEVLFFRAGNPIVLDLSDASRGGNRFTRLAPSRPGCWINVIPASGLVLIPEASAGCVCPYFLQTSMAFLPRTVLDAKEGSEEAGRSRPQAERPTCMPVGSGTIRW